MAQKFYKRKSINFPKGKLKHKKWTKTRVGRSLGYSKYNKNTRFAVQRSLGKGFPKKLVMTHKYTDVITYGSGTAGIIQFYNISCNSLFDPNRTASGHQPMFYDQMAALYNHYVVIGSRIRCRITKADNSVVPLVCGVYVNDDTTNTYSTLHTLLEQTSARSNTITLDKPYVQLTKGYSAKKTFGGSIMSDVNLGAPSGSSPTEETFWTFFFDSANWTTQTVVQLQFDVEYIAVWTELKETASS